MKELDLNYTDNYPNILLFNYPMQSLSKKSKLPDFLYEGMNVCVKLFIYLGRDFVRMSLCLA